MRNPLDELHVINHGPFKISFFVEKNDSEDKPCRLIVAHEAEDPFFKDISASAIKGICKIYFDCTAEEGFQLFHRVSTEWIKFHVTRERKEAAIETACDKLSSLIKEYKP